MNHLKRAAVLILCLVTLCSFSFAEDTFVLPTEEPADSGFELPEIASAGKYGALPDPANYMKPGKETPIHQSEEYQTNGKTYNIWVYPDATFATYHFEHYKDDCEKAGYTVSRETISGQSAYVIRGEQEAYVFPDYNDTGDGTTCFEVTWTEDIDGNTIDWNSGYDKGKIELWKEGKARFWSCRMMIHVTKVVKECVSEDEIKIGRAHV